MTTYIHYRLRSSGVRIEILCERKHSFRAEKGTNDIFKVTCPRCKFLINRSVKSFLRWHWKIKEFQEYPREVEDFIPSKKVFLLKKKGKRACPSCESRNFTLTVIRFVKKTYENSRHVKRSISPVPGKSEINLCCLDCNFEWTEFEGKLKPGG